MEKALLKFIFLVVLLASASCLLHGAEARELANELKPDEIQCRVASDCVSKCFGCAVNMCKEGLCVCQCAADHSTVQS